MEQAYFAQIEQKINSLLSEKKFKEAHKICVDMIEKFPEDSRFKKIKEKIEKEVENENEKAIKEKLKEILPLWKEEKYDEILKALKPLLEAAPTNENLKRTIIKAQNEYKKKIEKLKTDFNNKQIQKFSELFEKNEEQLIQDLFQLEKGNPGNKDIKKLTASFRDKIIERRIKEKEDLITSEKYEDIAHFIQQLKKIDEKNTRILDLEKQIKISQHGYQLEEKGEFVYQATKSLDTLIRLKKYDKAIKIANEILDIDKENKEARKILKEAEKEFFKQTRNESIDVIKKNQRDNKKEYEKDKSGFIKL